jgi:hypothetical protein
MRQLVFLTFLTISFVGFSQKQVELNVTVTDEATNQPLNQITVEYRDIENNLLFTTSTNEQGKSSYSVPESQSILVMVHDKAWIYDPLNDFYSKKNKNTEFNFRLRNIASTIEGYKNVKLELVNDSTTVDVLTDCEASTEPEFPGGQIEMRKFLMHNLRYPDFALEFAIGGRCYTRFIIDEKGKITNLKIQKGIEGCAECDLEIMRVLSIMPAWKPATCNGKVVPMYYNLPIKFTPG